MSPKARHEFDEEPKPRKTPFEGSSVQPFPATPATPAAPAGPAPVGTRGPGASGLKRLTQMIPQKPPVQAVVHSPLLGQLAAVPAQEPPPEVPDVVPAKPSFLAAAAGAPGAEDEALLPRATTIATVVDAEMGSTFISGRIKLQVLHFPALNARRRILIVNEISGAQQNIDLAQHLWSKGYEVVILHHRGEAGSDGHFSLKGIERDIRQCHQQTIETGHRDRLWKSTAPVVLIGGGVSAPSICGIAAEDERLGGVVLIEPYVVIPRITELGNSPIQPADLHRHMQAGVVNMIGREMLNDEWDYLAQYRNPIQMAEKGALDHMPILHITAEKSLLLDIGRQFSTVMKNRHAKLYHHVHMPGSATHFWRQRQELIDVVSFWIDELK